VDVTLPNEYEEPFPEKPRVPVARRLALVLAVVVGLLFVLVAALPYLVSLDAVRTRVVAAAESALHRKVEAGAIRLQIFSGLGAGVEKVIVRSKPGWESPALLSADRVSVKLAFWPLLSRRVEVRRVVLDGAAISVERDPTGALSIDDFLSASGRPSAGAQPATAAAFLISNVEITRGRLSFVDRKIAPGETVTTSLEDLSGRISSIGPSAPARIDLAARSLPDTGGRPAVAARNFRLKGAFGPPKPGQPLGESPLRMSLSAKGVALAKLGPYLGAKQEADPGVFSFDATFDGAFLTALRIAGNLALVPRAGGGSPIPAIDGQFVATLDWPHGVLILEKSPIAVAKLPLTMQGRIDDLRTAPRVDLALATPGEAAIDSVTGLPGVAGTLPAGLKLSGRVRLSAEVSGPMGDLAAHASVAAAPLEVSQDGQPTFTAASATATLESKGRGPLSGRIQVPAGKLEGLNFENLLADWSWDEGALVLSPVAEVCGGRLTARVEADLAHAESESRAYLELAGVRGEALVETMTTVRNALSGTLNGKMSLTSRGLSWDAITKTGKGDGHVSIADADLKTVHLLPEVAKVLTAIGTVARFRIPASLESTKFDRLETSLHLADGRVATPDLTLTGHDVAVSADGALGLDKTLTYQGRIVLQPSLVKSLGTAGRYIADPQGRVALPFRAAGPIAAPRITIDETVALDLGRRVLAREAGERVGGPAGKLLGDVLGGGGEQKSAPADFLNQFLRPPAPTPTAAPR
jgi:AsmA protein